MQHPGGAGGGAGHSAKHTRSKKHVHGKAKHHPKHQPAHHHQGQAAKVHTKAHHAKHPRGLAIGDWLPVCTFEALAASLRLAGAAVSDDDVLELAWLAGGGEIAPVSILEALEAAAAFGLAGFRPVYGMAGRDSNPQTPISGRSARPRLLAHTAPDSNPAPGHPCNQGSALILGVDMPGPHAVLATADGWWSWGSLWSPWTAAVSEAWAVSWS